MEKFKNICELNNSVNNYDINKKEETQLEGKSKQIEYINIYWDEWKM